MIYNLKTQAPAAKVYLLHLIKKEVVVELKEIKKRRTLPQNRYLHLLLSAFGLHFGYTIEEAKIIFKQLSPEIFQYEKKNRIFYKSSAEVDTKEMTDAIEKFRNRSAQQGLYLPSPDEKDHLNEIENDATNNRKYL